jgi:hypothetical protein
VVEFDEGIEEKCSCSYTNVICIEFSQSMTTPTKDGMGLGKTANKLITGSLEENNQIYIKTP